MGHSETIAISLHTFSKQGLNFFGLNKPALPLFLTIIYVRRGQQQFFPALLLIRLTKGFLTLSGTLLLKSGQLHSLVVSPILYLNLALPKNTCSTTNKFYPDRAKPKYSKIVISVDSLIQELIASGPSFCRQWLAKGVSFSWSFCPSLPPTENDSKLRENVAKTVLLPPEDSLTINLQNRSTSLFVECPQLDSFGSRDNIFCPSPSTVQSSDFIPNRSDDVSKSFLPLVSV